MSTLLPENWRSLRTRSREAQRLAYAPYSKFAVGACLECDDGQVFTGCNVENASYGLTICAERVAVCSAVAAGQTMFRTLCLSLNGQPVPCGACRQFLFEFNRELVVIMDDVTAPESALPEVLRLSDLLPHGFSLNDQPSNRQ